MIVYFSRFPHARYLWRTPSLPATTPSRFGVGRGDVVQVMLANTPHMFEAHYGVPMSGATLGSVNTRLNDKEVVSVNNVSFTLLPTFINYTHPPAFLSPPPAPAPPALLGFPFRYKPSVFFT